MHRQIISPCTILRVQTWDSKAMAPTVIEDLLERSRPRTTGAVESGCAEMICVGPADWLVIAAEADATKWLDRFASAFDGRAFRASDVSDALARFEITGSDVRDLLAKGCSLDLHSPLFPAGRSARTRFAGMPVIVRSIDTYRFELIVEQSYVDYLRAWLADAELEFQTPA